MSLNNSSEAFSEFSSFVKFLGSLQITPDQRNQLNFHIERVVKRLSEQEQSRDFLKSTIDDLSHNVRAIIFDLRATRMERDERRLEFKNTRTDHSN